MSLPATSRSLSTCDPVATIFMSVPWACVVKTRSAPVWTVPSASPATTACICACPLKPTDSTLTPFLAKMPRSWASHTYMVLGVVFPVASLNVGAEARADGRPALAADDPLAGAVEAAGAAVEPQPARPATRTPSSPAERGEIRSTAGYLQVGEWATQYYKAGVAAGVTPTAVTIGTRSAGTGGCRRVSH